MEYFIDKAGEVFAYDDDQVAVINRINAPDFDNEKEQIPAIFFEVNEEIKGMKKMTAKEIDAHINPPLTREQLVAEAEAKKQYLLSEAAESIAPLQDAVELDMATPEEESALKEWKKYRVMLNRVDTSTAPVITWPVKP